MQIEDIQPRDRLYFYPTGAMSQTPVVITVLKVNRVTVLCETSDGRQITAYPSVFVGKMNPSVAEVAIHEPASGGIQ